MVPLVKMYFYLFIFFNFWVKCFVDLLGITPLLCCSSQSLADMNGKKEIIVKCY